MAAHNQPYSEHSLSLGKALLRWREMNGLSQQDIHNYGQGRGVKIFNSQVAYSERGLLCPKPDWWIARHEMNQDLANEGENGFKFIKKEITRKRFQKAGPFLNAKGQPATAMDMFGMFIGHAELNPVYLAKTVKITEEHALNYSNFDRTVFEGYSTDEMLNKKEAWEELKPNLEKVLEKKYMRRMQMVIAGQSDWTVEEINTFTDSGRKDDCAVLDAFKEWTGNKMPKPSIIRERGSKMKWPQLA